MKLALDHYFLKLRQNLAKSIACCCCWPGGKRYLCEKMQVCLKMLKICSCSISFSDSFSHTTTCLLACEFVVSPAKHYNNKHNNYAFPSNCHCSKKSNKLWERGHISLFGTSFLLWPTGINWGITGFWFGKITFQLGTSGMKRCIYAVCGRFWIFLMSCSRMLILCTMSIQSM